LQQVLINLVMNAKHAMSQHDGFDRTLIIATEANHEAVTVSVIDNGPGVDPELRDRLFGPFVTNKPEGIGLGLSLCASIIGHHGGRIWSDFVDGRGATFRFSIPSVSPEDL
jgi:C4-dicarboxylate-specific signal transduction histidine kinase